MRALSGRFALLQLVRPVAVALGLAAALAGGLRAQSAATAYAWSNYPNADTFLFNTTGVAVDAEDNVYASLHSDHYVVKISPTGVVTTLAGAPKVAGGADGVGGDARFNSPQGITIDAFGAIYVADDDNATVRKISPAGRVVTLAGVTGVRGKTEGPPGVARFGSPRGVALDAIGDVFVTDWDNSSIRLITLDNLVQTVAGGTYGSRDAVGITAQFMRPWGIASDAAGNLYVTDTDSHTVRKIAAGSRITTTIAGSPGVPGSADGVGAAARFREPTAVVADASGVLFVVDSINRTIRRIGTDGQVTTIGGKAEIPGALDNGVGTEARFFLPRAIAVTRTGVLYVADYTGIRRGEPVRAPAILTQPKGLTARENTRVSLTVGASGAPAPTYQWRRDGVAVPDGTAATLTLAPLRAEHAGDYTVVVRNSLGSVTSAVATLVVDHAPKIAVAPQPVLIGSDGVATLSVTATGPGPITYQWLRNGDPVAGATNATYTTGTYGNYSVAVTNAFGTSTTGAAPVRFPSRLVNLSTNGIAGTGGSALVAGVVVAAPAGEQRKLLIRAVGPTLRRFGAEDALAQTALALLDQRGTVLARNSGWATNPVDVYNDINFAAGAVGAFPLQPGSGDSALLVEVPSGNYTVSVEPVGATAGRSLLEIYEVQEGAARLANLSLRGRLEGSDGTLTVGFVAFGTVAPKLLIRAVGPGLRAFGVDDAQARPTLKVFNGRTEIASNVGWSTAANVGQIEQAATAVGAFPLARNAADSALLLTLDLGGNYQVEVTSGDRSTGTVLIEIYQVL